MPSLPLCHRRTALVLLLCLWLPAAALAQVREEHDTETIHPSGKAAPDDNAPDLDRVAQIIIDRTNAFRKDQGRSPVEVSPQLRETADYFAHYMARTNKYGHTADGHRPSERAKQHGYDYCIIAENIAYEYSSLGFKTTELGEKFFEGWKHSPEHRKNMVDPDVIETGVAVARSEDTGYYYAVQMFGRPKSRQIEFKVVNQSGTSVRYKIGDKSYPLGPRYIRTHYRCRPAELTFSWPDQADERPTTVEPSAGDRLVVVEQGGEFKVRKK